MIEHCTSMLPTGLRPEEVHADPFDDDGSPQREEHHCSESEWQGEERSYERLFVVLLLFRTIGNVRHIRCPLADRSTRRESCRILRCNSDFFEVVEQICRQRLV